jgi:GrpB-like predicted nucleotidyltransferase (UPF0157 family)
MRKVEVVPHDPKWREQFEVESQHVSNSLGENVVAIHHIGSTAIPGIYAKPIIDLLVEVKDIANVDAQTASMQGLGYEAMGEFGIPGRRFFRKDNPFGDRTHHIHTFTAGSAQVERHLAFRDYMIAHPKDAQTYSQLKYNLAQKFPANIEAYMDGKDGFIRDMDMKAAQWCSSSDFNHFESGS